MSHYNRRYQPSIVETGERESESEKETGAREREERQWESKQLAA